MKFFDTDWICVFRWLAVWEKLSVPARRHYLLAAPSHAATVSTEGYGNEKELVLEAGLAATVSTGRLKPTKASVPFRALMAQLAKFPLFDQKPTRQLLDEYAVKHYLREENDNIRSSGRGPAWDSQAWPQSFLDQPNLKAWEKNYLTYFEREGENRPSWVSFATSCLTGLKLAEDKSSQSQRLLVATTKGRKWLAQPPADRLRELLFEIKRRDPGESRGYIDPLSYMPADFRFDGAGGGDFDHHTWLGSIWRQTPDEGCMALGAFLDYHARLSHPLVNPVVPDSGRPRSTSRFGGWARPFRAETIEEVCREVLEAFFWQRLVPLGCVETTAREDGQIWFRLSTPGKYLFGQSAELAYGEPSADAAIVIQPNFDIVFLHPNLNAEVELSPLAERAGRHVGTLFRLTRRKAILAAAQGTTAEAMLATLAKYSSKPVPANVAEEIRSWFAVCRSLTTRRSVLIETGDRETALRVQRLLGPRCVVLKDTLLEWRGTGLDPKLRRKLIEQGLFPDVP